MCLSYVFAHLFLRDVRFVVKLHKISQITANQSKYVVIHQHGNRGLNKNLKSKILSPCVVNNHATSFKALLFASQILHSIDF